MLNKKMMLSLLIIGLVAASASAGTWAKFTDTETGDSTYTAGCMDLKLDPGQNGQLPISADDVVPGEEKKVGKITVENEGDAEGKLYINVSDIVDYENKRMEPEKEAGDTTQNKGELSEKLKLIISGNGNSYEKKITNMDSPKEFDFGTIGADQQRNITVKCIVSKYADSTIQSDSVDANINFELEQVIK